MKYKGLIGEQMSGSLGGVTASHNKGGTYFRRRRTPVNTVSIFRSAVKAVFAALSTGWTILTNEQRDSWTAQASVQPVQGVNGPIHINGNSFYIRNNSLRVLVGKTAVPLFVEGPTTDLPQSPTNNVAIVTTANITVDWNPADGWATSANGGDPSGMAVFATPGFNASKKFPPTSERLIGVISGTNASLGTAMFANPLPAFAGQRVAWSLRGFVNDGSLTTEVKGSTIAT